MSSGPGPKKKTEAADNTRLFTREEALGGVSGRRARALLFLIEYWAARLAWQARRQSAVVAAAMDLSVYAPILLSDELFRDQEASDVQNAPDDAYYRAFGLTREDMPPVTLAQIEDYASEWARIVPPDNPRLCAQVGRLLIEKYHAVERKSPGLRSALGLDTEPVRSAYQSLYRQPLSEVWSPAPTGLGDKLRGLFGRR